MTIEQHLQDLRQAIRAEVITEMFAAFSAAGTLPAVTGAPAKPKRTASDKTKSAKRSPSDLAQLADDLRSEITNSPGQRIEQIAVRFGISSKDLFLPVQKLLAAKKIRTKGRRRGTTYYPR